MKIKIFKSNICETADTNNIESTVNSFINGKNIIDIKQSIATRPKGAGDKTQLYFITITVMYNE
jgi:hypothetical protein